MLDLLAKMAPQSIPHLIRNIVGNVKIKLFGLEPKVKDYAGRMDPMGQPGETRMTDNGKNEVSSQTSNEVFECCGFCKGYCSHFRLASATKRVI